jgi:arabinose-5-phosphate isomerase
MHEGLRMTAKSEPRTEDADLASARRALRLEADGISKLADSLDPSFKRALDLIAGVAGRVVVTGMGKSGHVARKIAATLASVGTPALYVHPGEASHGDLGMITVGDAIVALSNSGETPELFDLLAYAKRHAIPLIAITSVAKSTLADAADAALVLPPSPEACPLGLAPMTSTTVMLALGDAIAVALLERKAFSTDDFQVLHPGGKLGKMLLRVSDIMHGGEDLPLGGAEASLADSILTMTAKRFGCVGVVDSGGCLVGVITDGDLRRHMGPDLLSHSAAQVMTDQPATIRPQALVSEALGLMNARKITNLFVVENRIPVGILHIHDCLRAGVA